MIETHPNHGRQAATDLGSQIQRVIEDSTRRPSERESKSDPRPNKSPQLNWKMLMVWSFVAVSFAALFFAAYVIWAKCRGS
jgi:hypothetical protein